MTSRTRSGLIIAIILTILVAGLVSHNVAPRSRIEKLEHVFPIMGTRASFTFWGEREAIEKVASLGRAEFNHVSKLCNLRDPESELSRLNQSAAKAPFVCSNELWLLLEECRRAYQFSDGYFDISTKPMSDLWGFYRKRGDSLPSEEEINATQKLVGLDKVIFDETTRTVRFSVEGMALDLGGIAKGYAVDLVAKVALGLGIRQGVIDLGGDLRLLPDPPPGKQFYQVGIRNPQNRDELLPKVLKLKGLSVATSGDYERFVRIGGNLYGHIMNPKTGFPTQEEYSVTIVAENSLMADWLSTSIFLGGEEMGRRAEKEFSNVQVIFSGKKLK